MNYIAIIGDIKNSKKIESRKVIQEKLNNVLKNVNETYNAHISAKFVITLGDEFQGLLYNNEHILDLIKYVQREMYPICLRFGIGLGQISTSILNDAALGADGPAYYAAREMIEQLREQEKKLKKHAADIQISLYDIENFSIEEINTLLVLVKIIEDRWTVKQRLTIWDMQQNGGSQEECAKRMNTTQSTVARRLADGNYLIYERAVKTINKALMRLGESCNDN